MSTDLWFIIYFPNCNGVGMVASRRQIDEREGIKIFEGTRRECADLIHKLGFRRSLRNMKSERKFGGR